MIELIVIFFLTSLFAIAFSILGVKKNTITTRNDKFHWNIYYLISLIILVIFIGTRDGVGVDFYNYVFIFDSGTEPFRFGESAEVGNIWLIRLLHSIGLNHSSYFLITSFLTLWLFFTSFRFFYKFIPIGILFFIIGGFYEFTINGIRQGVAMMAFYNALQYLRFESVLKRRLLDIGTFFFFILIGSLFHYSILIFIPLVLIMNKAFISVFNSIILIIIVIAGFFIDSVSLLNTFSNSIIEIFPRYEYYTNLNDRLRDFGNFGIGAFLILLVNIVPLLFYNKIKKAYPETAKYFILFAFGTSLMYAFSKYMMADRIILYLSMCSVYVFPCTYLYLKKSVWLNLLINKVVFIFLIVKFIYVLPLFVEIQIPKQNFSLWFISMSKTNQW